MTTTEKPLAVVTGASSGIGLELAKQFAQHDFDVVLTAEDDELAAAAEQVRSCGAAVDTVRTDLARPEGVEELVGRIAESGRPVEALAVNAGVGINGEFAGDTRLDDQLTVVDLNVRSAVHLAKRVVPGMVERGRGRVLFTSSIAGAAPGPYQVVYSASKAFLTSFSEGLRGEVKDKGITVTALLPGPTDTEFFERADMEDTKIGAGPKDSAADVAEAGFAALMAGDDKVVTGAKNKATAAASRVLPDEAKAAQQGKMMKPGSAEE
ncbi:SDR family oxidoreductase [Amycolatopsis sp. FDAARGOS 1241]|uniref:SDR family NAD(P)-dependent oxidoreductase n=1 Tax=Amycolatopsis sp. FDAARGOS 1241 TaxID=2778070 RepID=UPI0019524075|nr:SDR family NAD(P)-dependent oxidoreductase [Amycolatopsis sp. FDAARGOS 1241]QRP49692.1 SDR family NAD(P)-dependent oxidoreductase [Amycolatopsis sp. FDAARGOS 1241]